ncbi:MAG: SdrD B-like domain-containing protein, partial [Steroidobacter sp.]
RSEATFQEHTDAPATSVQSNAVRVFVSLDPPDIEFFGDDQFLRVANVADHGQGVYVQVRANACDQNPRLAEHVDITIATTESHDSEIYEALETGVDTGTYRIVGPVMLGGGDTSTPDNDTLEVGLSDRIEARVEGCGSGMATADLLVDPAGVLFDSRTNEPIAGATVRLIDVTGQGNGGFPGGDAVVLDFDGSTRVANSVVTGPDGSFQFPMTPPSVYRLMIVPPGDYRHPSTVPANQLPSSRLINTGSYGEHFQVDDDTSTVMLDIPLDSPDDGLFVQKRASRDTVEIADTLQYTVTMRNTSGLDLSRLTLTDTLPPGFTYMKDSARLDGEVIADPTGGKGPTLDFPVDGLSTTDRTLTYRVAVGPGALEGDGINRAILRSSAPARKASNTAAVGVKIEGGVFGERAYVLGKVFADCNSNSVQDVGEPGVPRVRLYMEDGSFVVTDNQGKYSFYGVTPRTHVLKVDSTSLPSGTQLAPISHRHGKKGNSQFVDVQRSEMHRADFAVAGCSDALSQSIDSAISADHTAEVAAKSDDDLGRELNLGLRNELKPTGEPEVGDVRALAASGIVGETSPARIMPKPVAQPRGGGSAARIPTAPTTEPSGPGAALQTLLVGANNETGFLGLTDGDEVGTTQIAVRVKGLAGSTFDLKVNDAMIGDDRVGTRVSDRLRKLEAWEFIGVDLHPGLNSLQVVQRDSFGNARAIRELTLIAPDQMARIDIRAPSEGVLADGENAAVIRLELEDQYDVVVAARTPVTLEATLGKWEVEDLDPNEPGTQVFIEGGQAEFRLRTPTTPGVAKIRATSGRYEGETQLNFVPALRPLIGAGLIEGTLDLSKFDMKAMTATRREDGFEKELRQFSADDGNLTGGARAALFLKGKVRGDYLLTLGYDSEKDARERLFRDIQPDRFYPVYGDSSVKGYDAQSTSRLYVRIDKDRSYLLAGDFTTQSLSQERKLGAYNRSLTGVNQRYERGPITINAFASHDNARQIVQEIPANGTSGPFFLNNTSALENSEQIEIITRDRDQPAVILSTVPQQRFTDYEIESFTGRILFRAPIPSVDENLNPISIRITYEAEQGGDDFWTSGIDTQLHVSPRLEVGAAMIDDQNPVDERRILSSNATLTLGEHTTLSAEMTNTRPG